MSDPPKIQRRLLATGAYPQPNRAATELGKQIDEWTAKGYTVEMQCIQSRCGESYSLFWGEAEVASPRPDDTQDPAAIAARIARSDQRATEDAEGVNARGVTDYTYEAFGYEGENQGS